MQFNVVVQKFMINTLWGISALMGSSVIYNLYKMVQKYKRKQRIRAKLIFSPKTLRENFNLGNIPSDQIEVETEKQLFKIKEVLITGVTYTSEPIKSKIKQNENMIHMQLFKKKVYSNTVFYEQLGLIPKQSITKSIRERYTQKDQKNVPYFVLRDINQQQSDPCIVHNSDDIQILPECLDTQNTKMFRKEPNPIQQIISAGLLLCQLIVLLPNKAFGDYPIIKGIEVGTDQTEIGIKMGGILAVLGDVIYNVKDNTLTMLSPKVFMKDKKNYLNHLNSQINLNFLSAALFAGLAILFGWGAKKCKQLYDKQTGRREAIYLRNNLSSVQDIIIEKDGKSMNCVCCDKQKRSVVLKPCNHLSYCKDCFDKLNIKLCPICKKQFINHAQIFIV